MRNEDVSFFRGCSSRDGLVEILEDLELNWDVGEVYPVAGCHEECGTIEFYEHKGIIRTDTCHPLSVMGQGYVPAQNRELIEILRTSLGKVGLTISEGGFLRFGKRCWVSAKHQEFGIGDFAILGKILLNWSHNGEVAISTKIVSEVAVPHWGRPVGLASFIPGNPDIYGGYRFKHAYEVGTKLERAYKEAQEFLRKLKGFYTSLHQTSFTLLQMERLLEYLYPNPDKIKVRKDGTRVKPYNQVRREDIAGICKEFMEYFDFSKFIATLAFNYYYDYCSLVRVTKDTVEEEQRLMSILFGTAHREKTRFLKAIHNYDNLVAPGKAE